MHPHIASALLRPLRVLKLAPPLWHGDKVGAHARAEAPRIVGRRQDGWILLPRRAMQRRRHRGCGGGGGVYVCICVCVCVRVFMQREAGSQLIEEIKLN